MTTSTSTPDVTPDSQVRRGEVVAVAILFALVCIQVLWLTVLSGPDPDHVGSVVLFFTILAGSYLGLSVRDGRDWLGSTLGSPWRRLIAGPLILLAAALLYAQAVGLPPIPRVVAYAAYLSGPIALLALPGRNGVMSVPRSLSAVLLLWLPIEFDLLPSLPLPPPEGYDASRLVAIVAAFYLFLVARPLPGVGYTFLVQWPDVKRAMQAVAVYAVIAVPLGVATGFLAWQPDVDLSGLLVTPIVIYVATALPEEFLFRGLIQNLLSRRFGPRVGLGVAAAVFGVAHLPDLRYVLLATLAGVAYGWVYARTGKITVSALTHTGVNWVWALLLSTP